MMAVGVQGADELTRKLGEIARLDGGKTLLDAAREAAEPVVNKARQLIPVGVDQHRTYKGRVVDPGFAKRSVRAVVSLNKEKTAAFASVGVAAEAFYAVQFVELGTAKMAAQPWLRPAYAATKQQQVNAIAKRVRVFIESPARRRKK